MPLRRPGKPSPGWRWKVLIESLGADRWVFDNGSEPGGRPAGGAVGLHGGAVAVSGEPQQEQKRWLLQVQDVSQVEAQICTLARREREAGARRDKEEAPASSRFRPWPSAQVIEGSAVLFLMRRSTKLSAPRSPRDVGQLVQQEVLVVFHVPHHYLELVVGVVAGDEITPAPRADP